MAKPLRSCLVCTAGIAVLLSGCSSDDGGGAAAQVDAAQSQPSEGVDASNADPGTGGDADVAEGAEQTGLEMTDVATGATTTLDAALASEDGKPVLAWFWAPFCPTCRGEAPELDAYMAENSERVKMVGIGTRNDLERAEGFLADTGVENFDLLWEPTGQSWVDNAVAAQPYMILLVDGEEIERWPGGASVRQIDDALAALS